MSIIERENVFFVPKNIANARKHAIFGVLHKENIIRDLINLIVEYEHHELKIGDLIVCSDSWFDPINNRFLPAEIIELCTEHGLDECEYYARVHYFRCHSIGDQKVMFYPSNSRIIRLLPFPIAGKWTGATGPDYPHQVACNCEICKKNCSCYHINFCSSPLHTLSKKKNG
jgi:hypothetical protein